MVKERVDLISSGYKRGNKVISVSDQGNYNEFEFKYNKNFKIPTGGKLQIGDDYIWIGSDGKLRVKIGAEPTGNLDGIIVGTQT